MCLKPPSRGCPGPPPSKLRMFPAAPQAVPAEPIPHPRLQSGAESIPIPLLALLPSKRNRLHLARLSRRPRAAGVQPRSGCGGIWSHCSPHHTAAWGGRDPRSESGSWEVLPSTQCWSQLDLENNRSAACHLSGWDQGNLSPQPIIWKMGSQWPLGGFCEGTGSWLLSGGMCSARSSRQAELKHAGISLQQGGTTLPSSTSRSSYGALTA